MNEENCAIYIGIATSKGNASNLQGGVGISVYNYDEQLVDESNWSIGGTTDSSELELIALIEAMAYAKDGDCLYSNSEYCVKGFNEWLDNWKAKGWRKSDKKPVANRHLWQQVDTLRSSKFVEVRRAHKVGDFEQMGKAGHMAREAL
ncbi:ribonuclease HI [Vibrio crassostreae]|uniref:RNase H family protein n=1 Tax=Vibrio crassostreae TaxID=246167 RepID=UPI001052B05D|nr:RNase H family protein [Vibrio crassostreae]TCO04123.1 RNase HI [Vibrio crassostreae]CAK2057760.1 ribonuclease HI [Vibrio crassostreae]CAK3001066.1 ribonuclease HI [Vibrio crassostreae]CAK3486462.1 ribonuclease HI [Vibrio crassostreae]CAK3517902.1 ribonuclease HI [Vibrio crassostreae]